MALLLSLEHFVMDQEQPIYLRVYAWLRLAKFWGSLRFSDLQWIAPHSIRWLAWGLTAKISRSKTTGPGKKVQTLQLAISAGAWLACPGWLAKGLEILRTMDYERDYLLPAANVHFNGFHKKMATYADAAAASQVLFARLRQTVRSESGRWETRHSYLLAPGAGRFWTEHAERNGATSIAAVLGIEKARRRYLGRWKAEASEEYVRTSKTVTTKLQDQIAVELRGRLGGEDFLDEQELVENHVDYLVANGYPKEDARVYASRLVVFNGTIGEGKETIIVDEEEPIEAAAESSDDPTEVATEADTDDVVDTLSIGYYVASSLKHRMRRLHYEGRCGARARCRDWKSWGHQRPSPMEFDAVCRTCWKGDATPFSARASSAATSSSSSSTSTQSESDKE